jgi:hypothetical protein
MTAADYTPVVEATATPAYTIRMDAQTAAYLAALLGAVSGSPDHKPRRATDAIYKALVDAGVQPRRFTFDAFVRDGDE